MTEQLPLFPLGAVLFPGMVLPLRIFEPRYRKMIARRIDDDPLFGVVLTRSGNEVGDQPEIHRVGTSASLIGATRYADGSFDLTVRGVRRFFVRGGNWDESYLTGAVEWFLADTSGASQTAKLTPLRGAVIAAFNAYLDLFEQAANIRIERPEHSEDALAVGYAICAMMPLSTSQRQMMLEASTPHRVLTELLATLHRERELLAATGIGGAANRRSSPFSVN